MSFDLLVFDPRLAPNGDKEFEAWYKSLMRWDQSSNHADLKISSPALQEFYQDLRKSFPPINQFGAEVGQAAIELGYLTRLAKRFLGRKQRPEGARELPEDFNESCLTDYTFCKDAIYIGFSWSVSEQALHATIDAALSSNVGFYYASADNARPLRKRQDLISFRNQIILTPAPKFTKTNLLK